MIHKDVRRLQEVPLHVHMEVQHLLPALGQVAGPRRRLVEVGAGMPEPPLRRPGLEVQDVRPGLGPGAGTDRGPQQEPADLQARLADLTQEAQRVLPLPAPG
eukprot:CAMPEP_0175434488 /NCGR_PEP_ID=MMETSP0095-20121207/53930_1 /TAXON_ID=311494 /ORGANISM="Alexandrium monilatum, Strain CCMP3105" /LENGTH=101 /DNA_ID=CAMNT_0016734031 /DNA_START=55 /DNA_END=356 /DNA_ORIENTATION=+